MVIYYDNIMYIYIYDNMYIYIYMMRYDDFPDIILDYHFLEWTQL